MLQHESHCISGALRRWALLAAAVFVFLHSVAVARAADSGAPVVRVLEYGLFSGPETSSCGAPPCFTLEEETRLVPLELLQRFGVGYVVEGGAADPPVSLRVRIVHPLLEDPATGRSRLAHVWEVAAQPGTKRFAGWEFSSRWEMAAGEWAVELHHGGKLLHRTVFQAAKVELCRDIGLRYALGQTGAGSDRAENVAAHAGEGAIRFTVQTASCKQRESAHRAADTLRRLGYVPRVERSEWEGEVWYVVRFGAYGSLDEAAAAARAFRHRHGRDAVTIDVGE